MRPDDQPRPDLDAAIDAVVPALTDVSHEAVIDSLRRTRVALSEARGDASAFTWRWRVAGAVALTIVLVAVAIWRRPATPGAEVASTARPAAPVVATAPREAAPAPTASAPASPAASQVARSAPAARRARRLPDPVRATSTPAPEPARRPDPLAALVAAVQAIPEDAWARASAPTDVVSPEVTIAPIAIAPLETPALSEASGPATPGEP